MRSNESVEYLFDIYVKRVAKIFTKVLSIN